MDGTESGGRERTSRRVVVGLLVAIAFVMGFAIESNAAASPYNCGELPGISRIGTMVLGFAGAIVVVALGGIVSWLAKSWAVVRYAAVLAFMFAAGLVAGSEFTPGPAC